MVDEMMAMAFGAQQEERMDNCSDCFVWRQHSKYTLSSHLNLSEMFDEALSPPSVCLYR